MSKTLTEEQIRTAALEHGLDYPALRAVCQVESGGAGYLPDGRIKILFERHVFWQRLQLPTRQINPASLALAHPGLCGAHWDPAHYPYGGRRGSGTAWAR